MAKVMRRTIAVWGFVCFLMVALGGVSACAEASAPWTAIPQIDCSTARIPITEAIYEMLRDEYGLDGPAPLCSKTHGAWLNLANGSADILFLIAPTQSEFDAFADAGVDIEMKIYGYDGLVFLGNEANPVNNLTASQIRSIYSGKTKSWDKIPGGKSADMVVYIRNQESGSQRLFESLVWAGHDMPDFARMKFREGEIDPVVTQRTKSITTSAGMEAITRSVLVNQYSIGFNIMSYVDNEFLRPANNEAHFVKATGNVQLRAGPGLGYRSVGTISTGTRLPYLGESSVDDRGVAWYMVQHASKGEVWVSSRYSDMDAAASSNLKLFSVDGYAPTTENFASGLYPFVTTSYVAIRADEPQDSPARRLFDWVGSEESRALIAENSTLSVAFSEPVVIRTAQADPAANADLAGMIQILNQVTLPREMLYAYTRQEIGFLRQGVFALSGKQFVEGKYAEYFSAQPWYQEVGGSDAQIAERFNAQQAANLQLITDYQRELRRACANLDAQDISARDLAYEKGASQARGEDVTAIQRALAAQGYLEQNQCDGVFGAKSANAVTAFQLDNGLNPSGIADADTRMLLCG